MGDSSKPGMWTAAHNKETHVGRGISDQPAQASASLSSGETLLGPQPSGDILSSPLQFLNQGSELPGSMVGAGRPLIWPWANGVLTAFLQAGLETQW